MLHLRGMLYTNNSDKAAAAGPVLVFLHVRKGTRISSSLLNAYINHASLALTPIAAKVSISVSYSFFTLERRSA